MLTQKIFVKNKGLFQALDFCDFRFISSPIIKDILLLIIAQSRYGASSIFPRLIHLSKETIKKRALYVFFFKLLTGHVTEKYKLLF